MKCLTDSAIELTWPGVPVTACASMRAYKSNTPAERSPHSRTIGLKAVRSSTWACSSTTAISRCHMICRSIRLVAWDWLISGRLPFHDDAAGTIDMRVEAVGDEGRGLVLGDHGRAGDGGPGGHLLAAIERDLDEVPGAAVIELAVPCGLAGRLARDRRDRSRIARLGRDQHRPAQHLDRRARDRALEQGGIAALERGPEGGQVV